MENRAEQSGVKVFFRNQMLQPVYGDVVSSGDAEVRFTQEGLWLSGQYSTGNVYQAVLDKCYPLDCIGLVLFDQRSTQIQFTAIEPNNDVLTYVMKVTDKNDFADLLTHFPQFETEAYRLRIRDLVEQYQNADEFYTRFVQMIKAPFITYLIAAISILLFGVMAVVSGGDSLTNPSSKILLDFGADFYPMTMDGQQWRLITNAFVHIGFIHLLFNMFVLLQAGNLVERLFGHWFFLLIYLGAALTGSLLSMAMHTNVISAGASGAIFGIYGALLAYYFRFRKKIPALFFSGIIKGAFFFIAFNLFFGMQSGIDNYAHLGGLIGGFLFGLTAAMPIELEQRLNSKIVGRFIMTALFIAILSGGAYAAMRQSSTCREILEYQHFEKAFVAAEKNAAELYNEALKNIQSDKISDSEFVSVLREKILPSLDNVKKSYWVDFEPKNFDKNQFEQYKNRKELLNLWIEICHNLSEGIEKQDSESVKKGFEKMTQLNKLRQNQ